MIYYSKTATASHCEPMGIKKVSDDIEDLIRPRRGLLFTKPCPLSVKRSWAKKHNKSNFTSVLVELKPCFVPLESEKAVCQAFIAATTNSRKSQQKFHSKPKKPSPNPNFILRPPLRMLE